MIQAGARILAWRNDVETRRWSRSPHEIAPEEHANWLARTLANHSTRLWVAEANGIAIGHVRIGAHSSGAAEVHLVLAQGAQNQFGDLPWTARVEMLLMQYMLARREIRDFLQSRAMVPYKEPWEAQVDTMKTLQGCTDTTVSHFRDLAVYGEQILLSIRYGDWINVNNEDSAKNWARYFRPEIQGYLHAYRAATGIDLTNGDTVDATIPGILLQKRAVMQRTR